jgi:small-conductance mechanosensitive channel
LLGSFRYQESVSMNWQERLQEGLAAFDVRLFDIGGTPVTVATLATALIILLITGVIASVLHRSMTRIVKNRGLEHEGNFGVVMQLVKYAIILVGFTVALGSMGINLTALFAAGALFAVAIGFAMQSITANFVSGLILLFERAVKPGDIVEVDGQIVRIRHMGIRATIGRTLNEEDLVIPNSYLTQTTVKNYTFRDRLFRLRAVVGVIYGSDMALVRQVLDETARAVEWRSPLKEPVVLLTDFGDSSVNFEVSVWIEDPWELRRRKSELNQAIWWSLKDAGITIAFPQLDVHFDQPVVDSLKGLQKAV